MSVNLGPQLTSAVKQALMLRPKVRIGVIVLGLGGVGLLATAGWFYREQELQELRSAGAALTAIADLKTQQLVRWRRERLADAGFLRAAPSVVRRAVEVLMQRDGETSRRMFAEWLQPLLSAEPYRRAWLLDSQLNVRLVHPAKDSRTICPGLLSPAEEALRTQKVVVADLHEGGDRDEYHIGFLVPLALPREGTPGRGPVAGSTLSIAERSAGVLVLEADAGDFLFPLIRSWPTASRTAETLLVRREGDSVLFLNPLRHHTNGALRLRASLSQTNLPAVAAVLGGRGVAVGRDYRGESVLATYQPIPDSPWFLVAKIDLDEVLAPWRDRSRLLAGLTLMGLGVLGTTGVGIWLSRQRTHYRMLYQAEAARGAAEKRYAITLRSIGDAVIMTDARGRVELLNQTAEQMTGWTSAEAIGQPLETLFSTIHEGTRAPMENSARQVLREGAAIGLTNHTLLIAKDGTERPIAETAAPIREADGTLQGAVLVLRDQTEARRAEQALRESEERYRLLLENSVDAILLTVPDGGILHANRAACLMFGRTEAELRALGREAVVCDDDPRLGPALAERARTGRFTGELTLRRRDGSRFAAEVSSVLFKDQQGQTRTSMIIRDITDRKTAERSLQEQAAELRAQNEELARFNRLTVGRELRIIELKDEVNALCRASGQPERYTGESLPSHRPGEPASSDSPVRDCAAGGAS